MNYTIDMSKIDIYEIIRNNRNNEKLLHLLLTLPLEEQEILSYRSENWPRKDIARFMDITLDKVRGIEERALKHLRHPARLQMINAIVDQNFIPSEKAANYFRK